MVSEWETAGIALSVFQFWVAALATGSPRLTLSKVLMAPGRHRTATAPQNQGPAFWEQRDLSETFLFCSAQQHR